MKYRKYLGLVLIFMYILLGCSKDNSEQVKLASEIVESSERD